MGRRRCCCNDCLIYRTLFSDATSLTDWTISGASGVVDGALELTGTDNVATYNTAHPQYPYPPYVQTRVKGGTDSAIRVLVSWSGSDGLIVELRPGDGCGELELIQVASGVETILDGSTYGVPGAVVDEWHSITACYDPRTGVFHVTIVNEDSRGTTYHTTVTSHTDGEYAGLGTGPTHVGTAYFENFRWYRLWYYGDLVQDDYNAYTVVTECFECGPGNRCDWIDASFESDDDLCEWTGATADWSTGVGAAGGRILGTDGSGADNSVILHRTAYPWDDRTGDISGNVLGVTAQTEDAWTFDFDHYHRVLLTIDFMAPLAGATLYGIICATDDENFTAAKVIVGNSATEYCGTIQLFSVASGVYTAIGPQHTVVGLVSGEQWTLQLNYFDGYVMAQIGDHGTYLRGIQIREESGYGPYVGLAATGGYVYVSEFKAGCRAIVESCGLASDQFAFDTTAWRTCYWNKLSGYWPTRDSFGDIVIDDDVNMVMLNPVPATYYASHNVRITGVLRSTAPVDTAFAITFGGDGTGDNYFKAELKLQTPATSSTLTLYKIEGGVSTQLDQDTLTIPSQIILTACFVNGTIYVVVYGSVGVEATGTPFGGYAGIVGEVQSGHTTRDLYVSTFSTSRIHAGLNSWDEFFNTTCSPCGPPPSPCAACESGLASGSYQLTVVGIGAGSCSSAFCDIDRTVVAAMTGCYGTYAYYPDPQPTCTLGVFSITLEKVAYGVNFLSYSGDLYIQAQIVMYATNPLIGSFAIFQFGKIIDSADLPYDCENMTAVELDFVGFSGGIGYPCFPASSPAPSVKVYVSSI